MLSRNEKFVLNSILEKCGEKSSCIVPAEDISSELFLKRSTKEKVNEILKCLEYDGYIDVILSDRHGQSVLCITLLKRGKGYKRETVQSKRYTAYKVTMAILCALITFIVGRLLYLFIK